MERLIKTEADYNDALAVIDSLMGAEPGTEEDERLEYWAKLVEIYEEEHYPIPKPTPLEAIEFAMDQQGLTRRDLEPFMGSKGVVSEVMAGKRRLSLDMIHALHAGLGIPLDTLAQEMPLQAQALDVSTLPIKEMKARGWINPGSKTEIEAAVCQWLDECGIGEAPLAYAARSSMRLGARGDESAMLAWVCGLKAIAAKETLPVKFDRAALCSDFLRGLVVLSRDPRGPVLARDYLAMAGIHLVIERHFAKTYMDGAALLEPEGTAVIGMSLRYDRIDNFWFTLLHEVAHLTLGHVEPGSFVIDDLEARSQDARERDADALAMESLIPSEAWKAVPSPVYTTPKFVYGMAEKLGIHPAIVAGRVRHETRNYRLFAKLVGSGEVRALFPQWSM
jgi:HTH-type transcriptional regulator/antitoxin HigA